MSKLLKAGQSRRAETLSLNYLYAEKDLVINSSKKLMGGGAI